MLGSPNCTSMRPPKPLYGYVDLLKANPNFPVAHFELAAALSILGESGEARTAAKVGLALDPTFTIRRFKNFSDYR